MIKAQPKVELSLNHRQVFFLFFGLSVVGCFLLALGVMIGRGHKSGMASQPNQDRSLAAISHPFAPTEEANSLIEQIREYSFKQGLATPATEGLPQTRDPEVPPRDEKLVKAERAKAEADSQDQDKAKAKTKPEAKKATEQPLAAVITKPKKVEEKTAEAKKSNPAEPADTSDTPKKRTFTLQMKAFAQQQDAEKLADRLKHNGHSVRVEAKDMNGRLWHRVRVGEYASWDAAVAAKLEFEKQEGVIAYVTPM